MKHLSKIQNTISIFILILFSSILFADTVPVTYYFTPTINEFSHIYLAGNITDWVNNNSEYELTDTDADGTYELTVDIDPAITGEVEYKFVIDGTYYQDINNPLDTGPPYNNSKLIITDPMITYLLPVDGSSDVTSTEITVIVAHSASNPLQSDKWSININGSNIENPATYYNSITKKLIFNAEEHLVSGENSINITIGSASGTKSSTSNFEFLYKVSNLPYVDITGNVNGRIVNLVASGSSQEDLNLTYFWFQDDSNPAQLSLSATSGTENSITVPDVDGEYYINVQATDTKGKSYTARRIISSKSSGVLLHGVEDYAAWINEMNLYEINAYAWNNGSGLFNNVVDYFDELHELGINTIWFTPIFESYNEGMGYHTRDYYKIHHGFGSNADFKDFVQTAHENGIRIILDLVISHTSKNHPFFQSCLTDKASSPYADWYMWNGAPGESSYHYYYDWDFIPNLNVNNPDVEEYLIDMSEFWITNYDIDGYRADVAWGIEQRSDSFWKNFTKRMRNVKPEIFLLAEAAAAPKPGSYDDNPSNEHDKSILFDDRFNSVYDWELRGWSADAGLTGRLNGNISNNDLHNIISDDFPEKALVLHFAENHDLPRMTNLYDAAKSKLAHSLIYTIPGIPLMYSGAETGQTEQFGGPSEDTFGVLPYFQNLITGRKNYIKNDAELTRISNTNDNIIYSYTTISDESVVVLTALNFSSSSASANLDISMISSYFDAPYQFVNLVNDEIFVINDDQLASLAINFTADEAKVFNITSYEFIEANADFITDKTSGEKPLKVQFSDQSTGEITNWIWDFGDGNSSNNQNPVHTFDSIGVFTVSLIVENFTDIDTLIQNNLITVTESSDKNILVNGYFDNEMDNWNTYVHSNASATTVVTDGVFEMNISNGGNENWNVQLIQTDITIESSKKYTVSFDASASQNRVINVDISEDGGSFNQYGTSQLNLTTTMQNFAFDFTMTNSTDENARFVINMGNSNHNVYLDNIRLTEYIPEPSVTLTAPNGGDILKSGKSKRITWEKQDLENVLLHLSTDNGQTWEQIIQSTFSGSSYNWTIPAISSTECLIKVSSEIDSSVYDICDSPFTIKNPSITITSLVGNEVWQEGTSQQISWTAMDIDQIDIQYTTGSNWINIASGIAASDGSYSWTIPNTPATECKIKLIDASDNTIFSESNIFEIQSDVSIDIENLPQEFSLMQNHPNPFNPRTIIKYSIPEQSFISINIYNIRGTIVKTLVSGKQSPGFYEVQWNGTDNNNQLVGNGLYFYQLISDKGFTDTKKIIFLK